MALRAACSGIKNKRSLTHRAVSATNAAPVQRVQPALDISLRSCVALISLLNLAQHTPGNGAMTLTSMRSPILRSGRRARSPGSTCHSASSSAWFSTAFYETYNILSVSAYSTYRPANFPTKFSIAFYATYNILSVTARRAFRSANSSTGYSTTSYDAYTILWVGVCRTCPSVNSSTSFSTASYDAYKILSVSVRGWS